MSALHSNEINLVRCIKCGKILTCSRYDTAALLEHIRLDHPEVDIVDTDTKQKRATDIEIKQSLHKPSRNSHENRTNAALRQEDEINHCQCSDEECDQEKCQSYNKEQYVRYENTEDEERGDHSPSQRKYVKDTDLTHYSAVSEILEKYPEIKECEYTPHNPNAQVVYTRRYKVTTPSSISSTVLQQPFQRNLYRTSIEKWRPANGSIFCPKCGCNKRPLIKTKAERFTYNEWAACCILSCWPFCFLPWILPTQNNEYLYCANCKTFLGLYDHNTNCIKPNRLYVTENYNNPSAARAKKNRDSMKESKLLANESPPQSSAVDSTKSKHLPIITIDGKELPPETVARIQKLKRYSPLIGIDIDALTNPTESPKSTKRNGRHKNSEVAAPSGVKENRQSIRDSV